MLEFEMMMAGYSTVIVSTSVLLSKRFFKRKIHRLEKDIESLSANLSEVEKQLMLMKSSHK